MRFVFFWIGGLLSGLCLLAPAACCQSLDDSLANLALGEGWHRDGDLDVYNRDNLFDLIDGEAELFFPYGFRRLTTAAFTAGAAAPRITVEIYEMGSLLDAFGVYSSFRGTDSHSLPIGAEAYDAGTQIVFYKGRFFVKLQSSKKPGEGDTSLRRAAEAVAALVPGSQDKPAELASVQVKDIVPQSEQYIAQGILGYECFRRGMLAQVKIEGEAKTGRVFVVFEETAEKAGEALEKYTGYLDKSGAQYEWAETPSGRALFAADPLHKTLIAVRCGARIVGVTRIPDNDRGMSLVEQLRKLSEEKSIESVPATTVEGPRSST